jgi:hypothetical protein
MTTNAIPRSLFKYRSFETNTIRMLCQAEVFFAKPSTFNDPFDCNPTVVRDVDAKEVERLWKNLALKRQVSKDTPKAMAKERALRELGEHRYNATEYGGRHDDGGNGSELYVKYLVRDIDAYVKECFKDHGVLSLAGRWNCPLMWSHYANEHRGICIEYTTDDHRCGVLAPVNYNSSRYLKVSDLIEWFLGRSPAARNKVFEQYFLAKASQWKYEKEWRVVSKANGRDGRPFRIASVHFGVRCDAAIITTVVKLLSGSEDDIRFYCMASRDDGFKLKRYEVDPSEIEVFGLRNSSYFELDDFAFEPMQALGDISGVKLSD